MEIGTPEASAQQHHIRVTDREHAGNGGETIAKVAIESGEPLAFVMFQGRIDVESQQVVGSEARIEMAQVLERVYDHAGSHQHDYRKRDLGHDQDIAQAEMALAGVDGGGTVLQRRRQIDAHGANCRSQAEQDPCENRGCQREPKNPPVRVG